MATTATDSPRRVLGDRDVNKLVASPSKKREEALTKGNALLLPKIERSSRSPPQSPSKKRNAEEFDEGVQQLGRKRAAVEVSNVQTNVEVELDTEELGTSNHDAEDEVTVS